jgi:hypothetical protein
MAAGFLAAQVASLIVISVRYPNLPAGTVAPLDALDDAIAAAVQFAAIALVIWFRVGRRGGGVRHDLGLVIRAQDLGWLAAGAACSVVLGVAAKPLDTLWTNRGHGSQAIGEAVKESSGGARILLLVVVVVLAPTIEEIVFRGIVLRGAMRRMPAPAAVLVSGASFGMIHLIDPSTFPSFPALMALGVVSAVVAVRSGSLSRSIMLHAGFNVLGALTLMQGVLR